ncbi:MAG: hypothetical protein MJ180_06235 [Candidatus Gastranaerophilales bacterium]|nr:hypothetical protein [Candidatus Gastranaerophilales bacterium]
MQINSVNNQSFGKIEFPNDTEKECFLSNIASVGIGHGDTDIFIKKYKTVDEMDNVKLIIGNEKRPSLKIMWKDITDPLFISDGSSDKPLFDRFNEALNYIILKQKLVIDKWNI